MPPIRVEFMTGTLTGEIAEILKGVLRRDAASRFSVPELQLMATDMTVIFDELHPWSEPTHDIVVRIDLHNFKERVDKCHTDASEMAAIVAKTLESFQVEEDVTVGVALMYSPIAWGTAAASRNSYGESGR